MFIAPEGQAATHAPHPRHSEASTTAGFLLPFSSMMDIAPILQVEAQIPQALHISGVTAAAGPWVDGTIFMDLLIDIARRSFAFSVAWEVIPLEWTQASCSRMLAISTI